MRIALIVATDLDGFIGRDNQLPWRLPADLQHFKRVTMGKPIVMGRRTHESIGKPLPGRTNIVLTRQGDYAAPGCEVASSVAAALAIAARHVSEADGEALVVGGAAIYRAFLPQATRLYWTLVQAHVGGDTRFPDLDQAAWREVERRDQPADDRNPYPLSFRVLERAAGSDEPEGAPKRRTA